jgi:hypothetical protein
MMKTKLYVLAGGVMVILLAVVVLPVGVAGAIFQGTATPGGLSDFVIPTSTPGDSSGVTIPTATPDNGGNGSGGLIIPTSTPGGPAPGQGLPPLNDEQLMALNLQPDDVPAAFATNQDSAMLSMAGSVQVLRDDGATDLADQIEQIITTYGWDQYAAMQYTACQPDLPVSVIYSDVAQLASPQQARKFTDDLQVRAFLSWLNETIMPARSVHGFVGTSEPYPGDCFDQAIDYSLYFEYWGLLYSVSMTADANTDPVLVFDLLDQLAQRVVARADALAPAPFPPTPAAGGPGPGPTAEGQPTLPPPGDATPTLPPPPPSTPATGTGSATLANLERGLPTIQEVGLPPDIFTLNPNISGVFTLDEVVKLTRESGLNVLADAIQQAGQQNGMIGQVVRVWDTGDACPQTIGLSLEIDITLLQTAQGAQAYMRDPGVQQAWQALGLFNSFEPSDDGILAMGSSPYHNCGEVALYSKTVTHGRFVITGFLIANSQAQQQDIVPALDLLLDFTKDKLDSSGLN